MKLIIKKIISGGQTGADRAALDFALEHNISCGGWCPKGRLAEDGPIDQKYPLKETASSDYEERTKMNVMDSDGTLLLCTTFLDTGSKFTIESCSKQRKPCLITNPQQIEMAVDVNDWIAFNNISILNIAGNRERNEPGLYYHTYKFLVIVLKTWI